MFVALTDDQGSHLFVEHFFSFQGSVFFALPDGNGLLYNVTGTAEGPKPVNNIQREVPCKTPYTEMLTVTNWLRRPQRFAMFYLFIVLEVGPFSGHRTSNFVSYQIQALHLCPEMHLTLDLATSYQADLFVISYDFVFNRIICVSVTIEVRSHLVMSIIQFMHKIRVHFWTYLNSRKSVGTCKCIQTFFYLFYIPGQ